MTEQEFQCVILVPESLTEVQKTEKRTVNRSSNLKIDDVLNTYALKQIECAPILIEQGEWQATSHQLA